MIPFDMPIAFLMAWLFLLGACLGSFLNVCVHRIPTQSTLSAQLRGLWSPPSSCPRCHNRIRPTDNIPLIGWLRLRGRCRDCNLPISMRYPLIELINGLLFVLIYWLQIPAEATPDLTQSGGYSEFGPQTVVGGLTTTTWLNWRYAYQMVLVETLLVASLIDLELKIIPDASTVPAMIVGLIGGATIGQVYLVPVWFQEPSILTFWDQIMPVWCTGWLPGDEIPAWILQHPHVHGLVASVTGLVAGGGIVWVVRIIGHLALKREAMGFGDVILMACIGSFLGWQPTVVVFFLAPVAALAVVCVTFLSKGQREIPFGPYLSLGAIAVIAGWNRIGPIAERFFQLGPFLPLLMFLMAALLYVTLQMVQMGKRLLGIPLYPEEEWQERWTSADQLFHFSGENVDLQQGNWQRNVWPGTISSRGQLGEQRWRQGK